MSQVRCPRGYCGRVAVSGATCLLWAIWINVTAPAAWADRIQHKDGRQTEGRVLSVDERNVIVETSQGSVRVPRSEVESILFGPPEGQPPLLKVEIRNVQSDDAVDVFLDGERIIDHVQEGGAWIDVTDRLNTGNHALRLRIHNQRSIWAYRLAIRINGVVTRLECGMPRQKPCACCGKTGSETGVIEDLPLTWIYVDREIGTAEVLP